MADLKPMDEKPMKRKRTIITRKRYAKELIVAAMGNLTAIFLMHYLFGEPWYRLPIRLMALLTVGIYFWWTWSNWPTNIDDDQE